MVLFYIVTITNLTILEDCKSLSYTESEMIKNRSLGACRYEGHARCNVSERGLN
jgi:hypothetical protein